MLDRRSAAGRSSKESRMSEWQPIETAPKQEMFRKEMFVVRAFGVQTGANAHPYDTDAYCVWRDHNGRFVRWPHPFPPTHWTPLPPPPRAAA